MAKNRNQLRLADSLIDRAIGRKVRVRLVDGSMFEGKIRAVAKYDFWLSYDGPDGSKRELVIHKGALAWVELL